MCESGGGSNPDHLDSSENGSTELFTTQHCVKKEKKLIVVVPGILIVYDVS